MLSVASPFFGAVEEVLTVVLNCQTARFRTNRQAPKLPTSEVSTIPFSDKIDVNNVLIKELSNYLRNHEFDYATFAAGSAKRPGQGVLTLHLFNSNLTLSANGPNFTLQRRGFRTKSYVARSVGKHAEKTSPWAAFFGYGEKVMTSLKFSRQESMKRLLDDTDMKARDKIKVAFAEGYLAYQPRGRRFPILNFALTLGALLGLLFYFFSNIVQIKIGSPITNIVAEDVKVTFKDVKGIDEAKEELMQIVEYLKDPMKFTRLGARLPKGVLLVGHPGVGKTLLAKAIAGEAGVPFFRTSGSEFEEMLVGLGAKRVRELFAAARDKCPCVIFIDEIDSIGSKRSNSTFHPYANQTINQLLTEMDGFLSTAGVIVLAATNRRDDLDPALTRPGRFDVEIHVPWPDFKGRMDILKLYLDKVKLDTDVNVETLAKRTVGFTGADIENMINQAALKAATDSKDSVDMHYLDMAYDAKKMGPAKKCLPTDHDVNLNTAYHEAGHALVAYFTQGATPINKVTITPRGQSLGHVSFTPDKEMYNRTKQELTATMDVSFGGRAAEELIFGPEKITTGAVADFQQASSLAESMVRVYGMSEKVGFRFSKESEYVRNISEAATEIIDQEIKRLLNESYERAKNLLKLHAAAHKRLADALMQFETLNAEEVKQILENQKFVRT